MRLLIVIDLLIEATSDAINYKYPVFIWLFIYLQNAGNKYHYWHEIKTLIFNQGRVTVGSVPLL